MTLGELFKRVDAFDWIHLDQLLGNSGHGRFWREVLWRVRSELKKDEIGMKYFLFWSSGYDGDRMETFETAAEMAAWEQRHPNVEISLIIHGMPVDRAVIHEEAK